MKKLISSTDSTTDIPKDSNVEPYENARRLSILRRQRKVLIVDDVIATGGTAAATAKLLDKFNCELLGFAFIIELTALAGRDILPAKAVHSIVQY